MHFARAGREHQGMQAATHVTKHPKPALTIVTPHILLNHRIRPLKLRHQGKRQATLAVIALARGSVEGDVGEIYCTHNKYSAGTVTLVSIAQLRTSADQNIDHIRLQDSIRRSGHG